MHADGIISQFEGYDALEEFDWDGYRERYGDIHRLDRILEAEGDTPNRYKVSKQADVLMLFYLFSADELALLFEQLGYPFDHETIPKNVEYYLARTSHGSTLSQVVHSWVLARRIAAFVAPLPACARQRHRRHPGRHDAGGHSCRRDGRHRRSGSALLPRHRDAGQRAALRTAPCR
jgi:hypothetical protein